METKTEIMSGENGQRLEGKIVLVLAPHSQKHHFLGIAEALSNALRDALTRSDNRDLYVIVEDTTARSDIEPLLSSGMAVKSILADDRTAWLYKYADFMAAEPQRQHAAEMEENARIVVIRD